MPEGVDLSVQISNGELRQIRELYSRDLLSVREIAHRLLLSRWRVRKELMKSGMAIHTKASLSLLRRNHSLPFGQLTRLYTQEGLSASRIARQLSYSRQHVVNRLVELRVPLRDLSEACTIYPKNHFRANQLEQAYLLGFRTGDLHVKKLNKGGKTLWVECASTKQEQIDLFLQLFQQYGHCWVGRPKANRARGMHALRSEEHT